jgi:hypothetical protein
MNDDGHDNPHDVELGDVYEDMDKGRAPRRLKVVEIKDGTAILLNTKTERMSRIRLDRLSKKAVNSHGYLRVERAKRPDGLDRPNDLTPEDMLHPSPGLELVGFGFKTRHAS